ncbi:mitochondrial ribosomal subunit S27-domain-containing protein [Emericellopsis atlantica]|uniref:Small ribosomal subunit protein mS33 n=1 Tax=Emericellopsis atlantica TaxID=2614577 RepID=A0A9P7ZTL8_9HYPO|nr:mitochondrial ribosomal subunit S27-domain-containing protein [Emericellopsis atlantica]KAG9258084.1 mitochondrial ribosomal subunit S27-domain-containing protein [Emericellopsis atlantica]
MSVPRSRMLDLMKAQCQVFATTYNPDGLRLGNKVLRQRLRGPALASYYPRKVATVKMMNQMFGMKVPKGTEENEETGSSDRSLATWDDAEEDRTTYVEELKARGKGNPKKKKEAVVKTKGFGKKKK